MKKFLSFLLSVLLLFVTVTPAHATSALPNGTLDLVETVDSEGNTMQFVLRNTAGESYVLDYYMNGILTTSYEINAGSSSVIATKKNNGLEQSYALQAVPSSVAAMPEARAKDRWYHAGYIQYGYSATFDCDPIAVVSWKDTDSYNGTYYVDVYQNSSYSDWVAVVTSTLISVGLSMFAPATIAAAILTTMIGYYGSEVINDIISIPFIEEYECSSVTYTMRAEVIGDGMETDVVDYEGGIEYWVKYVDAPDENYYTGWTPRTWACRDFAVEVWDDSVPFWPAFPGVVGYPTYI